MLRPSIPHVKFIKPWGRPDIWLVEYDGEYDSDVGPRRVDVTWVRIKDPSKWNNIMQAGGLARRQYSLSNLRKVDNAVMWDVEDLPGAHFTVHYGKRPWQDFQGSAARSPELSLRREPVAEPEAPPILFTTRFPDSGCPSGTLTFRLTKGLLCLLTDGCALKGQPTLGPIWVDALFPGETEYTRVDLAADPEALANVLHAIRVRLMLQQMQSPLRPYLITAGGSAGGIAARKV